jgi:hypothetical protein
VVFLSGQNFLLSFCLSFDSFFVFSLQESNVLSVEMALLCTVIGPLSVSIKYRENLRGFWCHDYKRLNQRLFQKIMSDCIDNCLIFIPFLLVKLIDVEYHIWVLVVGILIIIHQNIVIRNIGLHHRSSDSISTSSS